MARSVPSASDTPQTHQEQNDSGPAATPDPTSDSLQVAAQVYPWIYMTSTLEACFKTAEKSAENDLATRGRELSEEESDISDQRVRLEAERTVEFYEELSSDKFSTEAPSIMQAFLSHGDACTALEADALKLASGPQKPPSASDDDYYSPMRPYNAMLDKLEDLQRELTQLHASILRLTQDAGNEVDSELDEANPDREEPSARSQMIHVFAACLSVLQARAANLEMARELLDGAKENLAMSLHLESLEFSDQEN
ncbi:hypothetical protein B0H10DRAFT_2040435 [Mycena sp. CBHHK59/15]|nr:hypothetical protein B0H10DRAFT_2040435 [Mycena sp. CBHHK59/15]